MKTDAYTKFILTIIALCLVMLAWETVDKAMAPEAQAQVAPTMITPSDTVQCSAFGGTCMPVKVFN